MRRFLSFALVCAGLALAAPSDGVRAQTSGAVVFLSTRPPRDLRGNIRGWANGHSVRSYAEDTAAHVWRVQFFAFLARPARSAEVRLVFYKLEGRTRRYVSNESVSLQNPDDPLFFHTTTLHRGPDEFQPMQEYEVAIAVADARGNHEIARGRVNLVGEVERRGNGVIDFTGGGAPQAH